MTAASGDFLFDHRIAEPNVLSPGLIPAAGKLLAQAFFDNPAHVYIFPDASTRAAGLEWLLAGNLRSQPDLSRSFCIVRGHDVVAMGFWTRSDKPQAGNFDKLRAGVWAAPFRLGVGETRRAFEALHGIERHRTLVVGKQSFWYLNNMAVAEEFRGTGLGSRLLTEQVARIAAEKPGQLLALSTQRERNVGFYERLGFEVAHEEVVGEGGGAFVNWTMKRMA